MLSSSQIESQSSGAQSFEPTIVLSVADFEQLLQQGGIEQQDNADRALMDRDIFVTCLRQQVACAGRRGEIRVWNGINAEKRGCGDSLH